ncbi:hypothetical protein [Streptomyces sp. NRRL B-24484]|uniref:hypothetical protein n=1 Tax=Streptomyces sp. NRRL B-24484 TaxID=1463833 RepID=UPI0004BFFCED|nr:hypothetical protein [Streptomyces sp. NRRL B-24484]
MHTPDDAADPAAPDHCTGCGSTDPEDIGLDTDLDGYSACCNEPVCSGPLPEDFTLGTPRRYPAAPCCDTDPRYGPALTKTLDDAGVRHHGLRVAPGGAPGLELLLGQDLPPEKVRLALAALRRANWRCRPERIDAFDAATVVRVEVGSPQRTAKKQPVLVALDEVLQLAGFSPYRFEQAEAFWGYRSDLRFGDKAGSAYVSMHGPDGLSLADGAAESARQSEAAQQVLRDAGWTVQPALGHAFHASPPVRPA